MGSDPTEPGRFHWRSPLGQTYLTRGDPIAPDLPDPIPRPPDPNDPDPDDPDPGSAGRSYIGPIFDPINHHRPPRPPPQPPPPPARRPDPFAVPGDLADVDDDAPFWPRPAVS